MPELRKDPVTGRWVIISAGRQKRPNDFRFERPSSIVAREHCPFCPGHEDETPPEILAYRRNGSVPNGPGWDVRVVPNKFPALSVEGTPELEGDGMFDRMDGIGAHEVIIESADHDKTLATMAEGEIEQVLWALRTRMLNLRQDPRLRHILVFKNQGGAAGATIEHTHSQLIALPMVPDVVRDELAGAHRHFLEAGRCVFCDIIKQEQEAGVRVVQEDAHVIALTPYAPRFGFETWLLPRRHGSRFEEASPEEYASLALALKSVLMRIDRVLERPPYNLVVHSAPIGEQAGDEYHWHVEILPTLTRAAGFEWGSGFYINPTSPEEATEALREVAL